MLRLAVARADPDRQAAVPTSRPARPAAACRPGDPAGASTVATLLALPLDACAEAGHSLGIRVPWDPEPLWFVPTPADIEPLVAEGVNPGRIWTAAALRDLLAASLTKEAVRAVAKTRIAFAADVVAIQPREPSAPMPRPSPEQLDLEVR